MKQFIFARGKLGKEHQLKEAETEYLEKKQIVISSEKARKISFANAVCTIAKKLLLVQWNRMVNLHVGLAHLENRHNRRVSTH